MQPSRVLTPERLGSVGAHASVVIVKGAQEHAPCGKRGDRPECRRRRRCDAVVAALAHMRLEQIAKWLGNLVREVEGAHQGERLEPLTLAAPGEGEADRVQLAFTIHPEPFTGGIPPQRARTRESVREFCARPIAHAPRLHARHREERTPMVLVVSRTTRSLARRRPSHEGRPSHAIVAVEAQVLDTTAIAEPCEGMADHRFGVHKQRLNRATPEFGRGACGARDLH